MIVDVHAHIIVAEITRPADAVGGWGPQVVWENGRQFVNFGGRRLSSALREFVAIERLLDEQARSGVDFTILTPWSSLFRYDADGATSLTSCRIQNDALAGIARRFPGRATALGAVPLQDTALAVAELERVVEELGLPGVEIGSNVNGVYLGDDRFRPFWAAAARLGAVVEIHPVRGLGGPTSRDYYLWNAFANPAETALTAAHLILSGVLESFPTLKICLVHGGGHLPYQIGRLDRAYTVRPEARARLSRPPSHYLRQFYFDTVLHAPAALAYLVALVGPEQVMLGSDYPFDMGSEQPLAILAALDLPEKARDQIRGDNARRLFGLG